jgi:hypothetical protein
MTKIIDSNLHLPDVQIFIHEITPVQMETVLGGYCQSCMGSPDAQIITLKEGINNVSKTTEGGGSYKDKRINSIDNSKKVYVNGLLIEEKS